MGRLTKKAKPDTFSVKLVNLAKRSYDALMLLCVALSLKTGRHFLPEHFCLATGS